MSRITEVREGIKSVLSEFGEVQVWLAPNEVPKSFGEELELDDTKFSVKIIVGTVEQDGIEDRVDDMVEQIVAQVARKGDMNCGLADCSVAWFSGHRLYGAEKDKPPLMGCEFHLKVVDE